jgi:hypothetical protein
VIDWAAIEPGLCALVLDVTGVPCVHAEGAEPFVDPTVGAIAKYQIYAVTGIGVADETGYYDPDASGDLVQKAAGVRELTFRLRVEAYDATAGKAANRAIEDWRDAMALDETIAALGDLGLTYLRTEAMVYQPAERDHRQRPWALVDMRMCMISTTQARRTTPAIGSVEIPEATRVGNTDDIVGTTS